MKNCTQTRKDTKIVLSENRMKMVFVNPSQEAIEQITVDGCAITIGLRCDYLVKDSRQNEFFIELKGTDVKHACKQLIESIRQLSTDAPKKFKFSFIVSSSCPIATTTVQKLQLEFRKKYNSKLIIKNRICCFDLPNLKEVNCSSVM